MCTFILDGRAVTCRRGISVLQAALENGVDVPHYCYHPGLSVVGQCRLCLMEMKIPDPKTKEMVWSPRLVPSCQVVVRDGLEVRFNSQAVRANQRHVMEHYLLNHPLDCPVCDKSGECWLQDYSREYGAAASRMIDAKLKNPKKDIGPRTLLYQDRCVLCTRCVRFCREVAGTGELCVVQRGSHAEIDVFPGRPLDNKLQGNVVDLCPVGALLDKDFLFRQRVWLLTGTNSVCASCSRGCAIRIDHNAGRVWRVKPRYNPDVNEWWMCDEGRFGWKYIHDERRLRTPVIRRGRAAEPVEWDALPGLIRFHLSEAVRSRGGAAVAVQLSPFMSCEEAWLLVSFVRRLAPEAALALGPVPREGSDEVFPVGAGAGRARFIIHAEKAPNRRGLEVILEWAGGPVLSLDSLWERGARGEFAAMWIVGGYPQPGWAAKGQMEAARKASVLIVQDLWPGELAEAATLLLPSCSWAEREGTFVNADGLIQPFARAINPPDGARADGQYLYQIAGHVGLYGGSRVREMMAREIPAFASVHEAPPIPVFQH